MTDEKKTDQPVASNGNGNGNGKKWETIQLAVRIGAVILFVVSCGGLLLAGGIKPSVEALIALAGIGAAIAGLALTSKPGGPGGTGGISTGSSAVGAAGATLLIIAALLGSGCAGQQRCLAERSTVAALGVAVGLAADLVPDSPEADQALEIARTSVGAGDVAVQACELVRDDSDNWEEWLGIAVSAVKVVLEIIDAAGRDVPPDMTQALEDILGRV